MSDKKVLKLNVGPNGKAELFLVWQVTPEYEILRGISSTKKNAEYVKGVILSENGQIEGQFGLARPKTTVKVFIEEREVDHIYAASMHIQDKESRAILAERQP